MKTITLALKATCIAGFLIYANPLFSQTLLRNVYSEVYRIKATDYSNINNISGSPYEHSEFRPAYIKSLKGDSGILDLRYNIIQDEMEYEKDNIVYWLNKTNISTIKFYDNREYIPFISIDGNKDKVKWFIVLNSGKYTLLKTIHLVFKKAEQPKGVVEPKPDRFERLSDQYYLQTGEKNPVLIRSKEDIEVSFPELKESLLNIKVRFSRENELIKMVDGFNAK